MNKRKKRMLTIVMLTVFSLYFGYKIVEQQKLINDRQGELNAIQAKIDEEAAIREELLQQKAMIHTDEYVEKVAREKLGYVKRGEKVFVDVNK